MQPIDKLNKVLTDIKEKFVGKNDVVDLLGISLVARENAFLLGPPGIAKSAIVKQLSDAIEDGKNFEYLLTRFTEPNEIFGPFDIRKLKDGELVTNTEGMLPEASLVFLDEIFNANSAILNSLLMALNERIFRRGKETRKLPVLMFVGASNQLPEDEALNALLDRFLIRIQSDYVDPDLLNQVLLAGWKMNDESAPSLQISAAEIKALQSQCRQVNLAPIREKFVDLVHNLRNTGIKVSDRRAVKLQNVIAASAVLSNRTTANISDFWVLKYIWDTEEQIEILAGIIDQILDSEPHENPHPQSIGNRAPNAEELIREVQLLSSKWHTTALSFEEKNVIKDKLRYVQNRSLWIKNAEHQQHIHHEIETLWQAIFQTT